MTRRKYAILLLIVVTLILIAFRGLRAKTTDIKNDHGIRPDVEAAIENAFPDSKPMRSAATQFARALQMGIDRPEDAVEIVKLADKGARCLEAVANLDPNYEGRKLDISIDIEGMVANTWARSRAYTKYNAKLSGMVFDAVHGTLQDCEAEYK